MMWFSRSDVLSQPEFTNFALAEAMQHFAAGVFQTRVFIDRSFLKPMNSGSKSFRLGCIIDLNRAQGLCRCFYECGRLFQHLSNGNGVWKHSSVETLGGTCCISSGEKKHCFWDPDLRTSSRLTLDVGRKLTSENFQKRWGNLPETFEDSITEASGFRGVAIGPFGGLDAWATQCLPSAFLFPW